MLFACSNRDLSTSYKAGSTEVRTSDSEKNYSTEGLTAESDAPPESLRGGTGITIGNGNSGDAEVEVASDPVVIGAYLTCVVVDKSMASCRADAPLSLDDLGSMILLDLDGDEIPKSQLELDFIDHNGYFEMIINVPSYYELKEIKEVSNLFEEAPLETGERSSLPSTCSGLGGGQWVHVPGNPFYGTQDFCVMKYEAKCSDDDGQNCKSLSNEPPSSAAKGTPWVDITQSDAITACASLGPNVHLISNNEWMTLSSNIAMVGSNWSSGFMGIGQLFRGHSDNSPSQACPASTNDLLNVVETSCENQASENDAIVEQRTHVLSNGEVIWDLAGNVWEWTSYFNDSDKPSPGDAWREYTDIVGSVSMPITDLIPQFAIEYSWSSLEAIGQYYPRINGSGGALRRGSFWEDDDISGVFSANFYHSEISTNPAIGFRCTATLP